MKRTVFFSVTGVVASLLSLVVQAHQDRARATSPTRTRYEARTWGANDKGQLGDGTTTGRDSPVTIPDFAEQYALMGSLGAGGAHTLFSTFSGAVWSWGANDRGQLGDGTTIDRTSPVRIETSTPWKYVSAGRSHSVAIGGTYDHGVPRYGTLWAWGANDIGQLGDGTTSDRLSPVQIGTSSDWKSISAGGAHSLAVKNDGTLWTWGLNSSGQLGDGTTTNRLSPVQIGNSDDWASVSAGGAHSFGQTAHGLSFAWGLNSNGQLGDGTITNRTNPVRIERYLLEAGENHSIGMRIVPQTSWATPDPAGSLDNATRVMGGVRVSGWAIDPETTDPIDMHVYIDGTFVGVLDASLGRPDLLRDFFEYGSPHGFDAVIPVGPSTSAACVYGINKGAGANSLIGCQTIQSDPLGSLDMTAPTLGGARVAGWALDPETTDSIDVHYYLDGQIVLANTANTSRPDVASVNPNYGAAHGFDTTIAIGPGFHTVCAYGINKGAGDNSLIGCRWVMIDNLPFGKVDVLEWSDQGTRVAGWVIDGDTAEPTSVHVYVDGVFNKALEASLERADVGGFFQGYGNAHGFDSIISTAPGPHTVCVYGINKGPGANTLIGCGNS